MSLFAVSDFIRFYLSLYVFAIFILILFAFYLFKTLVIGSTPGAAGGFHLPGDEAGECFQDSMSVAVLRFERVLIPVSVYSMSWGSMKVIIDPM